MSKGCVPFFIGRVYLWIMKLCTLHTQSAALAYTILESAISNSGLLESAISLTTQIMICTKLVSDVKSMMSPVLSVISSLISLSRDALFIDVCACYWACCSKYYFIERKKTLLMFGCIKICRKRFNYSSYYKYLGKERHKITFCCSVIRVQMF